MEMRFRISVKLQIFCLPRKSPMPLTENFAGFASSSETFFVNALREGAKVLE